MLVTGAADKASLVYSVFVPLFALWRSCVVVSLIMYEMYIVICVSCVRDVIFQSIGSPMKFVRMGCVVFVVFRLCVLLYVEFGHFMVSLVWVVLGVLGRMVC